jgi:hypothetical protein
MTSSATRTLGRRRSWIEPALWLGIPALLAVGPWAAREWAAMWPPRGSSWPVIVQLTGDRRRDCLAVLARAWADARVQPMPDDAPPAVVEGRARRQAGWLAEIAEQWLPLQPEQAQQAAAEAIRRLSALPERMGPEEFATPDETPTGRLLRLAHTFHAVPAVARRARQAAWEQALAAPWPATRVYALCTIARESARAEPVMARAALRQAQRRIAALPAAQRPGALAALAGTLALSASPNAARSMAARAVRATEAVAPDPEALAAIASLIAPAARGAAERLAEEAVDHAARATVPPREGPAFRTAFLDAPREPIWLGPGPRRARARGWPWGGPAGGRRGGWGGGYGPFPAPGRGGGWGSGGPYPVLGRARYSGGPGLRRGQPLPVPGRGGGAERGSAERSAADAHLRRVAAVLAPTHPMAAERAALRVRGPADRSGSLAEVAALVEERDPRRAAALYRLALRAADQIDRPAAARRAARLRAATGLALFDAPAALAVVEPLPPRLIALQLNEFAARLARQEPEAALRLIERGEQSIQPGQGSARGLFGSARAAVAARLARRDRRRAATLVAALGGRRSVDAWLTLARGLAAAGER